MTKYFNVGWKAVLGTVALSVMVLQTVQAEPGTNTQPEKSLIVEADILEDHAKRVERMATIGAPENRPAHYVAFVSAEFHKLPGVSFDLPVVKLVFKDEVFFDFDEAVIRDTAYSRLQTLVALIEKEAPGTAIFVAGHTDALGPEAYNNILSDRRSFAVTEYLLQHADSDAHFYRVGFGETLPVAPNATEDGRARNRRVEFFFAAHRQAVEGYLQQQSINRDEEYFLDGEIPPQDAVTILETSKEIDSSTGKATITDQKSGKIQLDFKKKKVRLKVS